MSPRKAKLSITSAPASSSTVPPCKKESREGDGSWQPQGKEETYAHTNLSISKTPPALIPSLVTQRANVAGTDVASSAGDQTVSELDDKAVGQEAAPHVADNPPTSPRDRRCIRQAVNQADGEITTRSNVVANAWRPGEEGHLRRKSLLVASRAAPSLPVGGSACGTPRRVRARVGCRTADGVPPGAQPGSSSFRPAQGSRTTPPPRRRLPVQRPSFALARSGPLLVTLEDGACGHALKDRHRRRHSSSTFSAFRAGSRDL